MSSREELGGDGSRRWLGWNPLAGQCPWVTDAWISRPTRELADHQRSEIKQLADCVGTLSQGGQLMMWRQDPVCIL